MQKVVQSPFPVVAPHSGEIVPAMWEVLRDRLRASGASFAAHENVAAVFASPDERAALEAEVEEAVGVLLRRLLIDVDGDPNTRETPRRVAKMFVREVMAGRFDPPPEVTAFDVEDVLPGRSVELYTVGPVEVRSMCAHHLAPIMGRAWVGILPGSKLIGLSKIPRVIRHFMARGQMQEVATEQVADHLMRVAEARGVIVLVDAEHHCMRWRGVQEPCSSMVTTAQRGEVAVWTADFYRKIGRG